MERKILSISMNNAFSGENNTYKVGEHIDGSWEIMYIIYKRDGLQSVNHRTISESCYLIALVNELNKETIYKLIPTTFVQEVTFIEIKEKESDDVEVKRV